jgi:hypothetical protein
VRMESRPLAAPHGDAHPVAADWDGDGALDLILGCGSGAVLWYRNGGIPGMPRLEAPEVLFSTVSLSASPGPRGLRRGAIRSKVCVTDWNRDGRLDLLIGDYQLGSGQSSRAPGEAAKPHEQARQRMTAALRRYAQTSAELQRLRGGAQSRETRARIAAMEAQCAEDERTVAEGTKAVRGAPRTVYQGIADGFVWLLLGRAPRTEGTDPPEVQDPPEAPEGE